MDINKLLAEEFKLRQEQIDNTIALFDDGKTIPFVARYRKEATGSLDDQILREIFDRMTYLRNLEAKNRQRIKQLEEEMEKLQEEMDTLEQELTLESVLNDYNLMNEKCTRINEIKELTNTMFEEWAELSESLE